LGMLVSLCSLLSSDYDWIIERFGFLGAYVQHKPEVSSELL
jgi:hypothetical protein